MTSGDWNFGHTHSVVQRDCKVPRCSAAVGAARGRQLLDGGCTRRCQSGHGACRDGDVDSWTTRAKPSKVRPCQVVPRDCEGVW
jgi:hypothetical protein